MLTLREHTETSAGLSNGELLSVTATCDAPQIISGGYAIATPERPSDRGTLIPIASRPINPQAWAVTLLATADTQGVIVTVTALCLGAVPSP